MADEGAFVVVINHEQQYSIWPAQAEPPAGWSAAGLTGSREECLDYIEQHWLDIRPLSMRRGAA